MSEPEAVQIVSAIRRNIAQGRSVLDHPLNRANPRSALLRWLRWRIAIRLAPDGLVVPYLGNLRLISERPYTSVTACVFYGLGEFEDMAFLLHALRPGDLFCDIGANAGIFTVLASGAVGARTLAFEPVPATYRVLRDNIRINGLEGLADARNEGLGSEPGTLRFTSDLVSLNHVVEQDGPNVIQVPVDTLDRALQGDVPAIIKMDVEGFEHAVLQGAAKTLGSPDCKVVLLELDEHCRRYGVAESDILALMSRCQFTPAAYSPFERKLVFSEGKNPAGRNTIFIRDREWVEARIRSAPVASVHGVEF